MAGQLVAPNLPLLPSLGPHLQVQSNFTDLNCRWIILALQSGVQGEVSAAMNALSLLAYKEKDNLNRGSSTSLLERIPNMLESLLLLIQEWHQHSSDGKPDTPAAEDDELFNEDDIDSCFKLQVAVGSSSILRSLSFLPENASLMASNKHFLEILIATMDAYRTEDEEIVTNFVDIFSNISTFLNLQEMLAQDDSSRALKQESLYRALVAMLECPVRAWHHGASEALAKLLLSPANEPILLNLGPQVFDRLSALMGKGDPEVQAAAVSAISAFAELGYGIKVQLAQQWGMIPRLLAIVKAPHPLIDVCRKASSALECLATEYKNRSLFMAYEEQIAEIALTEHKCSEQLCRVLWELASEDGNNRGKANWSIWTA